MQSAYTLGPLGWLILGFILGRMLDRKNRED
jgi:hypothetical protein